MHFPVSAGRRGQSQCKRLENQSLGRLFFVRNMSRFLQILTVRQPQASNKEKIGILRMFLYSFGIVHLRILFMCTCNPN